MDHCIDKLETLGWDKLHSMPWCFTYSSKPPAIDLWLHLDDGRFEGLVRFTGSRFSLF